MSAPRLVTAGVIALVALSGCATTTTTTTAVAAPVAAKAALVKAVPAAPVGKPPALATTGSNWPKVVGSLVTYGQWLLANPNPALASGITVAGCAADNTLTAELRTYVEQGAYVQPTAPVLTSIVGPTGTIGGQVTVDIQAVRGSEPVYVRTSSGSTTHVVAARAALAPTSMSLTLIRGADARWRICTGTDAVTTLL
ncbi:hypothetical protein [Actinoplanes sp. L3-i22]|uniref:hypothetical protein n=1 Tax=Actinoplanes sp. L3-i22 TaxID=2836373 RepID=UPI001C766E3B|nr:hypothetical protein [Actinoplanes sp. L3-i22]BCY11558.1 hypothetical protein L3i22_066460 [Actinoplanes sp. L3-i22]